MKAHEASQDPELALRVMFHLREAYWITEAGRTKLQDEIDALRGLPPLQPPTHMADPRLGMGSTSKRRAYRSGWACEECIQRVFGDWPACGCQEGHSAMVQHLGDDFYIR